MLFAYILFENQKRPSAPFARRKRPSGVAPRTKIPLFIKAVGPRKGPRQFCNLPFERKTKRFFTCIYRRFLIRFSLSNITIFFTCHPYQHSFTWLDHRMFFRIMMLSCQRLKAQIVLSRFCGKNYLDVTKRDIHIPYLDWTT